MFDANPEIAPQRAPHLTFYLATKADMLRAREEDAAADRLVQGTYWKNGRGCSVGCALRALGHDVRGDHAHLADALYGGDERLARLEDKLFERQSKADAMTWPQRLLRAIPEGVDLRPAVDRFMVALLVDHEIGVARFADARGCEAIASVAALYKRRLAENEPPCGDWRAAAHHAAHAAAYAADTAAYPAAYARRLSDRLCAELAALEPATVEVDAAVEGVHD